MNEIEKKIENLADQNAISKETIVLQEEKTESSLSSQIQRLQKRLKHMEFNISHSIKRGDELSKKCFELMKSTELLAFDMVFTEYLFSDMPSAKVYEFLGSCVRPSFNLTTGKSEDFDAAIKHVQFLQGVIESTANNLLKIDFKSPAIPKRTSEFVLFLKDQKIRLENDINGLSNDLNPTINETYEQVDENNEVQQNDIDSEEFPSVLNKWLQSELKFGTDPDEDTIELRCLISNISRRLASVTRLHQSITTLKEASVKSDEISFADCETEDLLKSPFYIGVQRSCIFMMNAIRAMQAQQDIIPRLQHCVEKCTNHIVLMSQNSRDAIDELRRQHSSLVDMVNRKQKEVEYMRGELRSFVDSVFSDVKFDNYDHQHEELIAFYHDAEQRLKNEMHNVPVDSDAANQFNASLEKLSKIIQIRKEIFDLCNDQHTIMSQIHQKDQVLFKLIAENKKADEESLLQRDEMLQLSKYEKSIHDAFESLHLDDMAKWCEDLSSIMKNLNGCIDEQKNIEEELKEFFTKDEETDSIEEKKKEIEELSKMNYQMSMAIGNAKLDLENAIEDLFRVQQEVEKYKNYVPECIDKKNSPLQAKKHINMAICPICNKARRDTILSTCCHVMCRSCLDMNHDLLCPICQKPYSPDNIKPFYLQ